MRVLVLGGSGMLGHKVWQVLDEQFETYAGLRSAPPQLPVGDASRTIVGVRADELETVADALRNVQPDAVVNCIGIVKQLAAAHDAIPSITVNALFPHQLAELCAAGGARLVQISTDCVFSGRKGSYREDDGPDPVDLYGRTKLLGETVYEHTLTIRTSIVGRELAGAHGLLEWFLAQSGSVRGYKHAIFSGLTTQALAETIALVIAEHAELSGVWHVAGEPIAKDELLRGFAHAFERDVVIEPDDRVRIDRSLDDSRFRAATGIPKPTWPELLDRLARDSTPYDALRAVPC